MVTMQIDPDAPSIHRGVPSSPRGLRCEALSLDNSDPHVERRPRSVIASDLAWCAPLPEGHEVPIADAL